MKISIISIAQIKWAQMLGFLGENLLRILWQFFVETMPNYSNSFFRYFFHLFLLLVARTRWRRTLEVDCEPPSRTWQKLLVIYTCLHTSNPLKTMLWIFGRSDVQSFERNCVIGLLCWDLGERKKQKLYILYISVLPLCKYLLQFMLTYINFYK